MANLDELQKALSEQRIEIFQYGYKNETDGTLMDEDYFDKEFEDLEVCLVDEPTCFELDLKDYEGKRNAKGIPDMRTKMGKDWAAQQMEANGIETIEDFLELCEAVAQPI